MDEHPNAKILRDMADRMKAGDMEAAFDVLADDVEWHEIGRAEPTRGKQALAQRYAESVGDFEIEADLHDVARQRRARDSADERHGSARRQDARVPDGRDLPHADGKITARWAFSDDTAAIVEFFG